MFVTMATTFGESAVLLLIGAILAALLTGFVAPVAAQQANRRRLADQKQFEETLRRESAFITAQSEFLKNLASAVFAFQAKALAVSYAAAYAPDRFSDAWTTYDRESFGLLGDVSALIAVAGTLLSTDAVKRLNHFYEEWLEGSLDRQLSNMALSDATTRQQWVEWHNPHHSRATSEVATLLNEVASDAGLTYAIRRANPVVG